MKNKRLWNKLMTAFFGIFIICAATFAFVFFAPAVNATAVGGTWQGAGTEENPYKISDVADLAKLAADVNSGINYSGVFFLMTNDIDLDVAPYNTGEGWIPIGTKKNPFKGSFDGNKKTIQNIYINSNSTK